MERFGKILNGGTTAVFTLGDMRLFFDQKYVEACPEGYKPVERILPYPEVTEGKKMAFRVTDVGDRLTKEGFLVDQSKTYAPRKISKLSLEIALLKRGLLDEWDAFLDSTLIDGTNQSLRRFYDQANDLSETHPMCDAYKAAARSALGVDEETFDAILDESIWTA